VLAHLGDALWHLLVCQAAVEQLGHNPSAKALHRFTVERTRADFQATLLTQLQAELTEAEQALLKQGRNLPVTLKKSSNQALHRQATAFEVLLGAWHLQGSTQRVQHLSAWLKKPTSIG
jgi:ribonuclease III family protein